jgi:predicted DNA-binding antitoxin AbrB/MazE fold protein
LQVECPHVRVSFKNSRFLQVAGAIIRDMVKTISAVYEIGVLRPLEPLELDEHQQVRVTVFGAQDELDAPWLDHELMAEIDAADEPEPTLEEVHQALSKIPENLSEDIRAERDARG